MTIFLITLKRCKSKRLNNGRTVARYVWSGEAMRGEGDQATAAAVIHYDGDGDKPVGGGGGGGGVQQGEY